ncbi:hypothetical protein [Tenacibaculum sp. SDUM215027]|uniref:hypothetical protein n=1 Tax=Tenacibaculum sp. SDUM215027 TaxID=3422596 RepID=UPI003D320065
MKKDKILILICVIFITLLSCYEKNVKDNEGFKEEDIVKKFTYRERLGYYLSKKGNLDDFVVVRNIAYSYNKLGRPDSSIYYINKFFKNSKEISNKQKYLINN